MRVLLGKFCYLGISDATQQWWQELELDMKFYEYLLLSLCFNGHFPGEPVLAGVYWSKGWWKWWWQLDYWSYKSCKAPVKSSPPRNQHPVFFTGRMPFLSPNQQCQSTEGKKITFHGLAYPKITWGLPTLSLTTNSSWLPGARDEVLWVLTYCY